jgi:uncharacterized protein YbjT (DUF2867 family)
MDQAGGGRIVVVAGATGLVGGHVLDGLLADARWSRVVVLTRRATGRGAGRGGEKIDETIDDKLDERVVDFDALLETGSIAPPVERADDVFACLGTTIAAAGTEERFRRVDHDYTLAVARLARGAGASRIALVSSVGASERSRNFYLRTKGETERDVLAVGFATAVLARPSFLVGERAERRATEGAMTRATSAVAPLLVGGLRKYRPIAAAEVASAMIDAVARGEPGAHALTYAELSERSRRR